MSVFQIILILLTVLFLSVGQILFKVASSSIDLSFSGLIPSLMSARLILALFIYAIATVLWLFVLKDVSLRVAYPFSALAFFVVPTLSHFFLGETVGWNTYVGAGIIAFGVIVSATR